MMEFGVFAQLCFLQLCEGLTLIFGVGFRIGGHLLLVLVVVIDLMVYLVVC